MEAGLAPDLAAAAVGRLTRSQIRGTSTEMLRDALAEDDHVAGRARPLDAPAAVEVFLGPAGAGKTTTIAKIAAQERAAGHDARALVAADGSTRVGAIAQLRTYAAIIGSPFRIADGVDELRDALDQARRPVLIDTAGYACRPTRACSNCSVRSAIGRASSRISCCRPADTTASAANRLLDRCAFMRGHSAW